MARVIPSFVIGQESLVNPWDADPKTYVQNLAILASKEQIRVQDQIQYSNAQIKDLDSRISRTKDSNLKAQWTNDLKSKKLELTNLKNELKSKINNSKQYKLLLSQTPDQIRTYFNNQPILKNQNAQTNQKTIPSKPSDESVSIRPDLNQSTVSNPPKSAIPSPVGSPILYEKWIGQHHVKSDCTFQSLPNSPRNSSLEPELLFTYTPEEVKKILKGVSYMKGYAFIGKEPGYTFLQLNLEIASDLALAHYGNLNKSFMIIKLINGKEIRLINNRFDTGKTDPVKKTTSLSGMYYINKDEEKLLLSSELDKIKLNFVSGYEDYIIYNVDFFTRQLICINAVK
jgi:hypothetical protein